MFHWRCQPHLDIRAACGDMICAHLLPPGSCLGLFQLLVSLNCVSSANCFSKKLPNTVRKRNQGILPLERRTSVCGCCCSRSCRTGVCHPLTLPEGIYSPHNTLADVKMAAIFKQGKFQHHDYRGCEFKKMHVRDAPEV